MSNQNQNWRWINDLHEVPESERRDYQDAKNEGVFTYFKRTGMKPENVLDKELAKRYSAWLAKNP